MRRLLAIGGLLLAAAAPLVPAAPAAAAAPATTANFEVMLVVDTSGSMQGAPIQTARTAAQQFVAQMPADVRIGVESFGRAITVLTAPTTDRTTISQSIDALTTGGNTPLHDAVIAATQSYTPAAEYKALVLLSDGGDRGSRATLTDAVASVSGMHVEAISLTTSTTDLVALQALGSVTSADNAAALPAAFTRVGDLLTKVIATTVPPSTQPATTAAPTTVATTAPATSLPPVTAPPTTLPAPAPREASDLPLYLGAGAVFLALFALTMLAFPRVKVSRRRLGIERRSAPSDLGKRAASAADGLLERSGRRSTLATSLVVAQISLQPGEFVALVAAISLALMFVGLFLGGPLVAMLLGLLVPCVTRIVVTRRARKRRATFETQLPDVLQLLITTLRSGYGLMQALDAVATEADEPARTEFLHVLTEARMGRDLVESLRSLAQRMQSVDLEWVTSAIDINRETGSNLGEVLDKVGATIRERQQVRRQVRTLTAEGRLSAVVITGMPVLLAVFMKLTNPKHFDPMLHGAGFVALAIGGGLLVIGNTMIRRVVNSITA